MPELSNTNDTIVLNLEVDWWRHQQNYILRMRYEHNLI
jgi:hypothetical protein